jgi:hypothetical protein
LLILTLDPNKFAEKKQQCLHIGNLTTFFTNVMLQNQSNVVKSQRLHYAKEIEICLPYPPDTKSFLYYYTPPEKPRIAAELRLRATSGGDPTSFESGSDLLKPNGQPWSRPLCVLSRRYKLLYKKLREDRLVPDDLDAILSTFTSKFPRYKRSQILYTLNDTFIVDFSCAKVNFFVITEQGMESLRFDTPFSEHRGGLGIKRIKPYTGAFTNSHLLILLD